MFFLPRSFWFIGSWFTSVWRLTWSLSPSFSFKNVRVAGDETVLFILFSLSTSLSPFSEFILETVISSSTEKSNLLFSSEVVLPDFKTLCSTELMPFVWLLVSTESLLELVFFSERASSVPVKSFCSNPRDPITALLTSLSPSLTLSGSTSMISIFSKLSTDVSWALLFPSSSTNCTEKLSVFNVFDEAVGALLWCKEFFEVSEV